MKEITFAIIGYGNRGKIFSDLLRQPEFFGRIVAVAEPDQDRRFSAMKEWGLSDKQVFETAEELLERPKLADAVIITTLDKLHVKTAIPAMKKGYHLFLEKPMAVTLEDCAAIERTQRETGVYSAVCHSLRYHSVYSAIKKMIENGDIGELMTFDQLEGVGDVHYTSSYVRGNWANESRSSFMLLTKSCHDIDLFSYLTGKECKRVASFGSLGYFTNQNKPAGATGRCMEGCTVEKECPYSCKKVYLEEKSWRVVFPKVDDESVTGYLKTGPYGKCVFDTDNNVVDHQVVILEYENGITGTFTMTAFHRPGDRFQAGGRFIRLHGTRGTIEADIEKRVIKLNSFVTGNKSEIKIPQQTNASHGGADALILDAFTRAVRNNDPSLILTSVQDSLKSHRIVFEAEHARREGSVVNL